MKENIEKLKRNYLEKRFKIEKIDKKMHELAEKRRELEKEYDINYKVYMDTLCPKGYKVIYKRFNDEEINIAVPNDLFDEINKFAENSNRPANIIAKIRGTENRVNDFKFFNGKKCIYETLNELTLDE